jgi:hypothetical protein
VRGPGARGGWGPEMPVLRNTKAGQPRRQPSSVCLGTRRGLKRRNGGQTRTCACGTARRQGSAIWPPSPVAVLRGCEAAGRRGGLISPPSSSM